VLSQAITKYHLDLDVSDIL